MYKLSLFTFLFFLSSCLKKEAKYVLVLPTYSTKIGFQKDYIYNHMMLFSLTHAKLTTLDSNLRVQKGVVLSSKLYSSGRKLKIKLNPHYRSFRGENINAEDLKFTFDFYASSKNTNKTLVSKVKGFNKCASLEKECELSGVRVVGEYELEINLKEPSPRFLESLGDSSFLILKKDKETLETVGECNIPYQTGDYKVKECNESYILLKKRNDLFYITNEKGQKFIESSYKRIRLTTEHPRRIKYPSLVNFIMFRVPAYDSGTDTSAINYFYDNLLSNKKKIANELGIEVSKSLTPSWILNFGGVKSETMDIKKVCPEKPFKSLVISSVPRPYRIKSLIKSTYDCEHIIDVKSAARFFSTFKDYDFLFIWISPSILDPFDVVSVFDCSKNGACFFNWKDSYLNTNLKRLRLKTHSPEDSLPILENIENYIARKRYAFPIGSINWWYETDNAFHPVHPLGPTRGNLKDLIKWLKKSD